MIWLVKTREKAITDGIKSSYNFLKECMEPADKYINKIRTKKITSEVKANVNYHLYQLIELYVDCKIISKWLSLKNDDEKLDFFLHFTDIEYLKKICDFTNSYCSQFEYNSFSDSMKNVISSLYNEYISDFKNAFQECVDNFYIQTYSDDLNQIDAISSMLSFYINQGPWTALRIIPTKLCAFEKIMFHGKEQFNFDYIVNPIMTFNKQFELGPVFDNQQFYSDAARDCFLHFLTLAKKIYDSNIESRIDKLETDVEILRKNDIEKSNTLLILIQFMNDCINKKNKKIMYYQTLSQDELIKLFYQIYKVPNNFLGILQSYPFEDKIILNEKFQIAENFQALLITYLDFTVVGRKDIALLKVLFHIDAKNPQPAKEKYVDRLDKFKAFIKNHSN